MLEWHASTACSQVFVALSHLFPHNHQNHLSRLLVQLSTLIREKDQALSALFTSSQVELEAALAASEAKAASTVLAVAASLGIPELSSPRRNGMRFPTSPGPVRNTGVALFSGGTGTASGASGGEGDVSATGSDADAAHTPSKEPQSSATHTPASRTRSQQQPADYVELLEGLAAEVSILRRDADEARSLCDAAHRRLALSEQQCEAAKAQLAGERGILQDLEVRVLDLEARLEDAHEERDELKVWWVWVCVCVHSGSPDLFLLCVV